MSSNGDAPTPPEAALANQLRDKDALRMALAQLSPNEVGDVLGMVLSRWDEVGDTPLVRMLRVLADWVESGQVPEDITTYERADGRTPCQMCGKNYRDHPARLFINEDIVLHELCDGALVKL